MKSTRLPKRSNFHILKSLIHKSFYQIDKMVYLRQRITVLRGEFCRIVDGTYVNNYAPN